MNGKTRPSPDFLIAMAILAVFGNALFCLFTLDDYRHLVDNPAIRNPGEALKAFLTSTYPGNLYRPLVTLSHWLVYSFSKLHPFWHHLLNVILHMGVCLLIYRLALRLVAGKSALLLALLFAVNPLRVEAVTSISGRAELLCSLFGLLGVMFFSKMVEVTAVAKYRGRLASGLFLCFFCALLSKESALVFLLLMPLYAIYAGKGLPSWPAIKGAAVPVAAALLVYLLLRVSVLGNLLGPSGTIDFLDNPLIGVPAAERFVNALALLGRYVFISLVPLHLSADYSFAVLKPLPLWLSPEAWVWMYFLALMIFLALRRIRSFDAVSFFALWFLLGFAVTSNVLFPIGTIFAERLSYLPGIGLAGLLAVALREVSGMPLRRVLIAFFLIFFAARSALQNEVWRDNYSLHTYQYGISPQSAKTLLNYGVVLRESGALDKSTGLFERALAVYPAFADASYNLGINSLNLRREDEARSWLDKTLKLNPSHPPALNLSGRIALRRGELNIARGYFERAAKIDRYDFKARIGLLAVAIAGRQLPEARALVGVLKVISPEHPDLRRLEQYLKKEEAAGT